MGMIYIENNAQGFTAQHYLTLYPIFSILSNLIDNANMILSYCNESRLKQT